MPDAEFGLDVELGGIRYGDAARTGLGICRQAPCSPAPASPCPDAGSFSIVKARNDMS